MTLTGFLAWLRSLFDSSYRAPRERHTLTRDVEGAGETIGVAIHQTSTLTERRGRSPEQTVGSFLTAAFDDAGLNYRIDYGFPGTFALGDEPTIEPATLDRWVEAHPGHAEHANLLLCDAPGGGYSYVGGRSSVMGANRIDRVHEARPACERAACRNVRGAIHEIGHCLGGRHATPILRPWPSTRYHQNAIELFRQTHGYSP